MARMLVERNFLSFRRTWSIIVSGFFEPVFFLYAMGVGIGSMVGDVDLGGGRAVPYLVFVAPALLASSAMNGAIFDSTTNVFFKLKYAKLYDSVLQRRSARAMSRSARSPGRCCVAWCTRG